MKQMLRAQVLLPVAALGIVSCTAWAMQTGTKLIMDSRVLSTDVQIFKGQAYVPLRDVAKALNRTVVKKGDTFRLTQPADADQRDGLPGRMTTNLFSGKWRLNVARVQQAAGYSQQYGTDKEQITPKEVGDILVIITCHLKNGTREMQEVAFDKDASGNTALTDSQEHGYVPLAYDSRDSGYMSNKMPPGSTHDFVVIFSVPKGSNLKDFIYTVGTTDSDKSPDFRVSLKS